MKAFPLTNPTIFGGRRNIYGHILAFLSFLVLTFLTVKTFSPSVSSNAETQTASQDVGPYTMSMSNDTEATIDVTPTASQAVYQTSGDLTVSNTCSYGATITMKTSSTDNSLSRSDALEDTIGATTGSTTLDEGTWGWSDDGTNWSAVPNSNGSAATVYDESSSASSVSVPVKFGVKVDNTLAPGTYTNDVIYTMTPKTGCLSYEITWNLDGGTAASGATYPTTLNWGETVDLTALTPTKSGYTFAGWTNGTNTFDGTETAANLNPNSANALTVTAKWSTNELLVTRAILNQGSFKNVTPTYLTNQVDGTDGFTIKGAASNTYTTMCGQTGYVRHDGYLRWDYQIDLTNYNAISFYARMNAKHGLIRVWVTSDGLKNTCDTDLLTKVDVGYNSAPTSWTKYEIDVSEITGTKIVSFIGGYTDPSGNSVSSTSYCNIRFQ